MDPLSIAASITSILVGATHVVNLVSQAGDTTDAVKAVVQEVAHIKILITVLQKFVDRTQRLDKNRASLVQLEDVVTILTQTVLVFSELEGVIQSAVGKTSSSSSSSSSPSTPTGSILSGIRKRVQWSWSRTAAQRLTGQLQQHKTSLSLLLTIMQW